eukprot:800079-Alexandrium_andersonii.AAC.1
MLWSWAFTQWRRYPDVARSSGLARLKYLFTELSAEASGEPMPALPPLPSEPLPQLLHLAPHRQATKEEDSSEDPSSSDSLPDSPPAT